MLQNFLIVGGASAYAPGLVKALIDDASRHDLELVRLYDIDPRRLEIVERLCRKMSRAADNPFRIEATTDQADAVKDIDALLNSSRPGGFEARKIDETLPLEFGIPGQETVGPGGFFFALRSIPAALDLADDVARHAPDATWLNYTNPTNIVGQALCDQTDLDVISLCDQSDEDLRALGDALGLDKDVDYDFRCSGLNHATWYRDIRFDGRPVGDQLDGLQAPDYYDEEHKLRFHHSVEMAKRQGDAWPNSYLPYYENPAAFVELADRVGPRTDAILERLDDYYEHFETEGRRDVPQLQYFRGSSGFGDMAADVVAALSSNEPTELVLNVPNNGLNDEFDDATVVEAFVDICAEGLTRSEAPPVPDSTRPLLDRLEDYQRYTAEAAITADGNRFVDALATNPLVDDRSTARQLLERARSTYGDLIPRL